jgi:hypothetical protein
MKSDGLDPPSIPHLVTVSAGALSLIGLAGLVLTLVLGFETPNAALLGISGALTFAIPLTLLLHFATSRTLTTGEKRMWMREFTGADAWSAMSEYMTSPDLGASARRRAEDAAARRTLNRVPK